MIFDQAWFHEMMTGLITLLIIFIINTIRVPANVV